MLLLLEWLLPKLRDGELEALLPTERDDELEELLPKLRVGALEEEERLPLKLLDEGRLGGVLIPDEDLLGVVFTSEEGRLGGVLTPDEDLLGVVFTPEEGRLGRSEEERLPLKRPLPLRLLS